MVCECGMVVVVRRGDLVWRSVVCVVLYSEVVSYGIATAIRYGEVWCLCTKKRSIWCHSPLF